MIIHHQFDPVLISIGPLAVRWYALSYILGFILFTFLGRRRIAQGLSVFTKESLDDFLTWGILGVILGGRLGYVLFYKFSDYLAIRLIFSRYGKAECRSTAAFWV